MNQICIHELAWEGPFTFFGSAAPVIFEQPIAESPGIYLWTFRYEDGYVVDYVGQTGKSFGERFYQHIAEQTSGRYDITDGSRILRRKDKIIWPGIYWKKGQWKRTGEYLAKLPEFAVHIHKVYAEYRLFLAPLKAERRTLERIEAAIALHLRSIPGPVGEMQDPNVVYRPRWGREKPFTVRFTSQAKILSLPPELEA